MAPKQTVVLDIVGLTPSLLHSGRAPDLAKLARDGAMRPLQPVLPAVTSTVQATFATGRLPREHGIVANGWYFRDLAEVLFWRQSNALVSGEKVWDRAKSRDPTFTCAKLFWWFNMYSSADFSVTPRPMYPADGRKIPDIYTQPASLRDALNEKLDAFPLFKFWGPDTSIASSRWIIDCARHVFDAHAPTLTLVYVPHLDYDLQRFGPADARSAQAVADVDALCAPFIEHVRGKGARVVVLSEYGITDVRRPVHLNRFLRDAKLLAIREELGTEKLDAGASEAFAVADHQLAHVYVKRADRVAAVRKILEGVPGVASVLDVEGLRGEGLDHPRSGELVCIAEEDAWFTYYFWHDDARAPDYARTVDIHRKPGYDPAELFFNPALRVPRLRAGARLAQKTLGFRYLMDVIGLDATIVKGSHGRLPAREDDGPLIVSSERDGLPEKVRAVDVHDILLQHVFGS